MSSTEDTLDLRMPDGPFPPPGEDYLTAAERDTGSAGTGPGAGRATAGGTAGGTGAGTAGGPLPRPAGHDLLGDIAGWGPVATRAGKLRLVPVRVERDLALVSRWMNDPAVAALWGLAGPAEITGVHLRAQLGGDGRSIPCLGLLDGAPMSYWEIYRADLAPVARHYPARPHDTAVHVVIGAVGDRGRGVGSCLIRAVSGLVLDNRPSCTRVVAEPDLRNTPSVAAFLRAGFRFSAEMDLPDRRAALLVRDRALRDLL